MKDTLRFGLVRLGVARLEALRDSVRLLLIASLVAGLAFGLSLVLMAGGTCLLLPALLFVGIIGWIGGARIGSVPLRRETLFTKLPSALLSFLPVVTLACFVAVRWIEANGAAADFGLIQVLPAIGLLAIPIWLAALHLRVYLIAGDTGVSTLCLPSLLAAMTIVVMTLAFTIRDPLVLFYMDGVVRGFMIALILAVPALHLFVLAKLAALTTQSLRISRVLQDVGPSPSEAAGGMPPERPE